MSIVISILALVFAVVSFWWLQLRRGKILSYPVATYAGAFLKQETILVFPLVLHNTGPTARVVVNMYCELTCEGEASVEMAWMALQERLEPAASNSGGREFVHPFVVAGRQAVEKFIEFRTMQGETLVARSGPYLVRVMAQIDHGSNWSELASFYVHSEWVQDGDQTRFIVRPNTENLLLGGPLHSW